MSVITISRGTMSGGMLLAESLAEQLKYRCIDRDTIVERAAAFGVSAEELSDALVKPPTFLDRLRHKKYLYLALIQAALTEEVKNGRVIYHGHAGHLLLEGGGPVFRVRIIAPMSYRISMARERLQLSAAAAEAHIQKMDESRQRWTQYLYGVDWTSPSLYDLVINLEYIDIRNAAAQIATAVRHQACFDFDEKCQARMNDLAIASRVKANLALNSNTEHIELQVSCADGQVFLKGKLPSLDLIDEIKRVGSAVPGVKEVVLSELVPSPPA